MFLLKYNWCNINVVIYFLKNDLFNSKDGIVIWCLIIYSKEWCVGILRVWCVKE